MITRVRRLILEQLPLIALLLTVLPATFPLWSGRYLWTDDGTLHLYRIVALDRALHEGLVYPRWAPDLVSGYGVPLFNYYSPLTYYVAEALHVLGFNIYDALRASLAVVILAAAVGSYLLALDLFASEFDAAWKRQGTALVVAVGYVYAPYFFADVYYRGALAEAFGVAWLPWMLWTVRRTARLPGLITVVMTAGLTATWILGHVLTVLFAGPLVIGFGLLALWDNPSWRARWIALLRMGFAAVLGALLSAFYWLPAFAEQGLTRAGSLSEAGGLLPQYIQSHLASLNRLVDLSWFYSYRTPAPWQIAIASICLIILALLASRWARRGDLRAYFLFSCAFAAVAFFLMGDWTRSLWLAHPSWSVIQFPWRMTLFINLASALGVGILAVALDRLFSIRPQLWAATVGLLGLNAILVGAFHLYPDVRPIFIDQALDLASMARWEVNFNTFGAGDPHEYIPIYVKAMPREENSQLLGIHALPPDEAAGIQVEEATSGRIVFRVHASTAASLLFRTFYFPDWRVLLDDVGLQAQPRTAFGMLGVTIPAGEHKLTINRGTTWPRQMGEGLSLTGLLVTAALAARAISQRESGLRGPLLFFLSASAVVGLTLIPAVAQPVASSTPAQLDLNSSLRLVGFVADEVGNDALHLRVIWQVREPLPRDDPIHWRLVDSTGNTLSEFAQRSRYGTGAMTTWLPNEVVFDDYDLPLDGARAGQYTLQLATAPTGWATVGTVTVPRQAASNTFMPAHPLEAQLGDVIHLLGYQLSDPSGPAGNAGRAGDQLPLTLFWKADDGILEDLVVFVHIVDAEGNLLAQDDSQPNERFSPTSAWLPGRVVADTHVVRLPANILPGTYRVLVGMYSYPSLDRLTVKSTDAAVEQDEVSLLQIRVGSGEPAK